MRTRLLLVLLFLSFASGEPGAESYTQLVQRIAAKRQEFLQLYKKADAKEKDSLITEARSYVLRVITENIFPAWYGTPWDFYGQTTVPGQGNIACGYFVAAVLSDAGFAIPRVKWAMSASEVFIKKLARGAIRRFSNRPIKDIETHLRTSGDGLYLVGLDCHVGFVLVTPDSETFIHSNYYQPEIGVMAEDIDSNNPLNHSQYRVFGKLLSDKMMINWMYRHTYQ